MKRFFNFKPPRSQHSPCAATLSALAIAGQLLGFSLSRAADTTSDTDKKGGLPLGLESYEPSAFGYTKNSDDVEFENIKLSVKFPLVPKISHDKWNGREQFFITFTGYWGFYITSRHSGPVVGKEYNPQFLWQHNLICQSNSLGRYEPESNYGSPRSPYTDRNCYVAVGYNHDSNGQIIDSPGQYVETQRDQGTEAANDAISRGWDYIRLTGKYIPYWTKDCRVTIYPAVKYFLSRGLLQHDAEELHYWEHPSDGKPRREVDGLNIMTKYQRKVGHFDAKAVVAYTTGYDDAFRFSTVRLEAGIAVWELPIVIWAQKGYMSDLSQYYRNVTGYGIEVEVGAF